MRVTPARLRRLIHGIALGRDIPARSATDHEKAEFRDLKRTHARWWNPENVVGLCVARKVANGKRGGIALQVLVREKLPQHHVPLRQRIPESIEANLTGLAEKIPTDVRAVGKGRLQVLVSGDRPVRPGFCVGGRRTGSGTLACVVCSRQDSSLLGLSCGHVIARYGQANVGEDVLAPSYENSIANDLPLTPLGQLVTVLPVGFDDASATENVDAATFAPNSASDLDKRIALVGAPNGVRSAIALDLPVQKVGYASEHTTGVVQALHVMASLPYLKPDGSFADALFSDLIGISSFALPGDSGALVLDQDNAAVGLHMGGFSSMSVCMPIARVLDAVDCDLA
jgi:hypothetical protein